MVTIVSRLIIVEKKKGQFRLGLIVVTYESNSAFGHYVT